MTAVTRSLPSPSTTWRSSLKYRVIRDRPIGDHLGSVATGNLDVTDRHHAFNRFHLLIKGKLHPIGGDRKIRRFRHNISRINCASFFSAHLQSIRGNSSGPLGLPPF
jgi:hypothetical protein